MKKLILLLVALPLFLANCAKESPQPEGPTNTVTTYKGVFVTPSNTSEGIETPAIVVVTENSSTVWSMSLEVDGQAAQVLTATKSGNEIQFANQSYLGSTVSGKGSLTLNGTRLNFSVKGDGTNTNAEIGNFFGDKS